jgi:FAD/FMN-containing dehydrogenase
MTWSNWSGSVRFTPSRIAEPRSEEELAQIIRDAAERGRVVRVAGKGHSSSPLVVTDDVLVSLTHLCGVESHDSERCEAVVRGGTVIRDAGAQLRERGLALHNTGDVDVQTLAGAIGTGTHGTGRRLGNLSTMLIGGRMVTATGEVLEISEELDSELLRAARVSLGTLGIFTALRLRVQPAFQLRRREWCTRIDDCLAHLEELVDSNRNFDFYWYPRSDRAKLRIMNEPQQTAQQLVYATCVCDETGWSDEILPRTRELRFEEIEYMFPLEAGPECFQAVRKRIKERWRREVAWRVLYRTVAADDAFLSPAHGRETSVISLHQNVGLPYEAYFADIEPLLRDFGGRPHWGKKHALRAVELRALYPQWDRFRAIRERLDPDGVFLSPSLQELLCE